MMKRPRIVIWGGSAVASPELVDCLGRSLLPGEGLDVVLVGRTARKLQLVGEVCRKLADHAEADLSISYMTDTEAALDGADYILNQIRVGGLEARAFDESFPHEVGLPGEETVGPGGFANALRTIPVVLEYCRLAEKVASGALILNLTNPSSFVQYAIHRYTDMRAIGICDTPVSLVQQIAGVLELPCDELEFDYVGMHHAGWVVGVRHRGRDVMPQVLERAEALGSLKVDPELIRAVAAVPSRYLRYYFHPERILANQQSGMPRTKELMSMHAEMLEAYASGKAHERPDIYTRRGAKWYQMIVVPVLLSLMRDKRQCFIVNVENDSTIPWLPGKAIIEVPCIVGASGAHPLTVGPVPIDVAAFVQVNCAYEMMAVQAIVEQSYDMALRALVLNPMVRSVEQARAVLDRVWPQGPRQ